MIFLIKEYSIKVNTYISKKAKKPELDKIVVAKVIQKVKQMVQLASFPIQFEYSESTNSG